MDSKLMEMKLLNETHAKCIYFLKKKLGKLGSLHVNNVKKVEARYEILENLNMMENFMNGEDYSVSLTVYGKKYL